MSNPRDRSDSAHTELAAIEAEVAACRRCPRLVEWRETVAAEKRAAYRDQEYWGRAVPSFGVADARLLIVGLAPAAHGANRTGRMFTGDRSGDWLYRALWQAGLANQEHSHSRGDGLELIGTRISAIVHCAPPANRPSREERDCCLPYLRRELAALTELRVILCLGGYAWENVTRELGLRPRPKFGHGAEAAAGDLTVVGSYHPSQQNTFTGRLTEEMLGSVCRRARVLAWGG